MTVVPAKYWWLVQASYLACGLLLGLADPLLGEAAQQMGARRGVATAVSVNLLMPLAAVALAVAYARLGSVLPGALSMTAGLVAGLAVHYAHDWSLIGLLRSTPPVLVAAAVGYAVVGTVMVFVVKAVRRRG
jgi:hypothetical protein